MSAFDDLVTNVLAAAQTDPPFAVGVVTDVEPGDGDRPPTVTVDWNGSQVPAACPQHYTPQVGDVVLMARFRSQLNIIGAY